VSSSLVAVAAVGVVVRCCVAVAVVVFRCGSLQISSFSVAIAFSVSVSSVSSSCCSIPAISGFPVRPVLPASSLPVTVSCCLSRVEVGSEGVFGDVGIFVESVLGGCVLEVGCPSPVNDSCSCH
jgi:hypothetical protein